LLSDYRDIPGPFDRIVSVGMFDVGVGFYETFFRRCADLQRGRRVVLHLIGRPRGPTTSP
jgi:cyclopropane-fatty-acyl-phospholipid synthase